MEDSHLCLQVGRCLLLQTGRQTLASWLSLSPDLSLFYIEWSTRGIPCAKARYYIKQSNYFPGSVTDSVSPQVIMPTKYARILKKISNMKNHWRFQLSKESFPKGLGGRASFHWMADLIVQSARFAPCFTPRCIRTGFCKRCNCNCDCNCNKDRRHRQHGRQGRLKEEWLEAGVGIGGHHRRREGK